MEWIKILPVWIGYLLDLIFGDPRNFPHPIRWFGHAIYKGESILNRGSFQARLFKGAFMGILYICFVFGVFYWLENLLAINIYAQAIFISVGVFFSLANRSLIDEGKEVFKALGDSLEKGRKRLSWIVGRETENLNTHQIRIATFETMSENLSDGVVAPLFYYALLGLPGAMAYKMANTLDSMIGYKNDKYLYFGRFSAKFDDVVNYIPARLTAFMMLLVTGKLFGIGFVLREGKKHTSPNAGYPEASLAYILSCRFGGPNYYHGKLVDKPYIGVNDRAVSQEDFKIVEQVNHRVCLLTIVLIALIQWMILG
ncbi:adenosylcobinamide-phosphate synthase CbiB [Aureibacter tunicatorum]|uniref:Cobalamin biosynthesis protein CobD n=1 Tax=Aureibacter tunicatorum TaxID=866807 RepID=A0AAE3XKR1_9BACT|nr:adenosylcobinamide-phosphate synthase CbiB [Aureibacter tunicatorum]MDR6237541.1 adenosylcobinamide-phosphate synthase [Aureibacter tunicatorum]BDD02575.1 cobalamin biosynthesis protein CobD [Aureibacter tunicatorum]